MLLTDCNANRFLKGKCLCDLIQREGGILNGMAHSLVHRTAGDFTDDREAL